VDSVSERGGFIKREARGQQRRIEKEPDKVLNSLVSLILVGSSLKLLNDRVVWVDFHGLLGDHVGRHRGISESLSFHDSLHVSGPAVLAGDENAGRLIKTLSDDDLLDLVTKDFLDLLAEWFEGSLLFFVRLLLIISLFEFQTFFRAVLKLLAIVLLELLDDVLINGVDHEQNLITSLHKRLDERRSLNSILSLTGDEENVLLTFFHSRDVVLQSGLAIA